MNKLATMLIAFMLVTSIAYAAHPMQLHAATGVDMALNHKYVWQLDKIDTTTTGIYKGFEEPPPLNLTDDLLNQLEGAKFEMAVGNYDSTEDVVYVVPIVIIQNDIQVTPELLEAMGVPSNYSSQLAFTIPKGSGLVFLYETFIELGPSLLMKGITGNEGKIGTLNGPVSPTSMIVSLPYYYGDASPPLPFVPTEYLADFADFWVNGSDTPNGITTSYTESGGNAVFSASGSNSSTESDVNYTLDQSIQIDKFEMTYSLTTGVLQKIEAKGQIVLNETWYDEWDHKWKSRYESVQIDFKLSFKGSSEIEIGLVDGQKIGYKVTEFTMSNDLVDSINKTIVSMGGEPLTPENITFINNVMTSFAWKFTYHQVNPYYNSGLDLFYDVNASNSELNQSETDEAVFNIYQLGSPYVTPDWEVQFATFQFQSFVYLKLWPKYYKAMLEQEEPKAYFNYDTDYKILESGDGNWISMITNASFNIGYTETNLTEGTVKFDASVDVDSWMTYSSDGLLSQIGLIISFSAKNDTNGDNSLGDETPYTGELRLVINRVQNQGNNPTQEPEYDQPVNVPTPSQSWQDRTPVNAQPSGGGLGGGLGGLLSGEIYGVPVIYIVGGITFLVIVGALLFAVRRR